MLAPVQRSWSFEEVHGGDNGYIHSYIHIHTYIHTYTYTYTHTYIHIYIHTFYALIHLCVGTRSIIK